MGVLRSLLFLAIGGGIGICIFSYWWLLRSLPITSGTQYIKSSYLSGPVRIVRDDLGVPHIYAPSDISAAFGLGYVHAQDRMWQMDLQRRLASGRLSAVVGKRALPTDRFFRILGLHIAANDSHNAMKGHPALVLLDSYVAGVNAWIEEQHPLPAEYTLFGQRRIQRWERIDSLTLVKFMSFFLGLNWSQELLRLRLQEVLGARAADIFDGDLPVRSVGKEFEDLLNIGESYTWPAASNNWVLHGNRTQSGLPLLANDPHLTTVIPALWYLAELVGDRVHVMGASLPGTPGISIGHNEHVAWGVTNLCADVQDLYLLTLNPADPDLYLYDGKWLPLKLREESIEVAGQPNVPFTVRVSPHHGPIISDAPQGGAIVSKAGILDRPIQPLAMRWTGYNTSDQSFIAFAQIVYAQNWTHFYESFSDSNYIGPNLNIVYADVHGNIARSMPGQIPIRAAGHSGAHPTAGWTDRTAWKDYAPYDKLPFELNPARGFAVTANDKFVATGSKYHIATDFAQPDRQTRIVSVLDATQPRSQTASDMITLQFDVLSLRAQRLVPSMVSVIRDYIKRAFEGHMQEAVSHIRAVNALEQWNGELHRDSGAAALFQVMLRRFMVGLIHDDVQFDDDLTARILRMMVLSERLVTLVESAVVYAGQQANGIDLVLNSSLLRAQLWCDDRSTPRKETCAALLAASFEHALMFLSNTFGSQDVKAWSWGAIHHAQQKQMPMNDVPLLNKLYSRFYSVPGDSYTVNCETVDTSPENFNLFRSVHGPGLRFVVDMADIKNGKGAYWSIESGQSEHPLSSHYDDFLKLHRPQERRQGALQQLPFGKDQATGDTLVLEPLVSLDSMLSGEL
eukprot:TRINITY_DN1199_c0_g1_i1.p1 TRINITY_DN1199_c0_g1~~TRINITY_DN1199_c0_g1_i1.p1  ORF type:complete len:851 (+),score=136.10 TRINITY_DN1199_c0_g1_i1:2322-4874(+)